LPDQTPFVSKPQQQSGLSSAQKQHEGAAAACSESPHSALFFMNHCQPGAFLHGADPIVYNPSLIEFQTR
jgi:hypothetical protein